LKLKDAKERYFKQLSDKLSEASIKSYRQRLEPLFLFFNRLDIGNVGQIDDALIIKFGKQLKIKTKKPRTLFMQLDQARKFLKWLYDEQWHLFDLSGQIVLPKWERTKTKKLKPDKTATANMVDLVTGNEPYLSRDRLIAALYCDEQLKTDAILILTVIDIDLVNKDLRLCKSQRFVQLKIKTWDLLKAYLKKRQQLKPKTDLLLLNSVGLPLPKKQVTSLLHRLWRYQKLKQT
jgi:site-specific recombinase XerC